MYTHFWLIFAIHLYYQIFDAYSEGLPFLIFHLPDLPSGKSSGLKTLWWAGSTSKPKAAWPSWKISAGAFCWSKGVNKTKSGQPKVPRPYVQQLRCHCRRPCGVQVQVCKEKTQEAKRGYVLRTWAGPRKLTNFSQDGKNSVLLWTHSKQRCIRKCLMFSCSYADNICICTAYCIHQL